MLELRWIGAESAEVANAPDAGGAARGWPEQGRNGDAECRGLSMAYRLVE